MIQIGALFKLLEQPPQYLPIGAPASFGRPSYRELILRGFDVRLEIGGWIYELSVTPLVTMDCDRAVSPLRGRSCRIAIKPGFRPLFYSLRFSSFRCGHAEQCRPRWRTPLRRRANGAKPGERPPCLMKEANLTRMQSMIR
jgi:hypothetical protein